MANSTFSSPAAGLGDVARFGEIRGRLLFLVGALVVYRIGTFIPVPGINPSEVARFFTSRGYTVAFPLRRGYGETGGRWLGGMDRQLRAHLLFPLAGQKLSTFIASENSADLAILRDLLESGKITPAIDRTYPLSQTPAAVRHVQEGRARGKVVITI